MAKVIMFEPGMQRVQRLASDAAFGAAKEVAQEIKDTVGVDEGDLKRSVRARKLKHDSRVYIGTEHWYFHEYGVEPHLIRARGKKVLVTRERIVLGKQVNHPGHRAYMPIRRAFFKRRNMATLLIAE